MTWADVVAETVETAAAQRGLEAAELLNSVEFFRTLDALDLADLDSADPTLSAGVQAAVEAFSEELHPRAAAGSSDGGQFTAGGSGEAPAKTKTPAKAKKTTSGSKQVGPLKSTLAYNPKTNTGPGYNSPHGDPHVHQLQEELNRLGVTDASGRKLDDDGKLGPLTTQAVKEAQRRLGLPQDGKVTPEFLAQLQAAKTLPGKPAQHSTSHSPEKPASKPAARAPEKPAAPVKPSNPNPTARAGRNYAEAEEVDVREALMENGIAYADPGYQKDGKPRYKLDSKIHTKAAWSYINQADNAAFYTADQLKQIKNRIVAALKKFGVTVSASEAVINGQRTFGEIQDLVRDALRDRIKNTMGMSYPFVMLVDIADDEVVYTTEDDDDLFQCSYSIADDDSVTLGDPTSVERTYVPVADRNPPAEDDDTGEDDSAEEAVHDRVAGRVLEAKGTDDNGGRIFRVRIIAYGKSRNKRRYTEAVMRPAVPLYEGAKAYDHHRTMEELQSSTINGLVGYYRNVEAEADGLYGDLHLLPGATHAAESLDAAIEAQAAGLEPVVGISHDVQAHFQPVIEAGERLQEAVQIVSVDSADIVAKPSAGGKAIRAVAGGDEQPDGEVPDGEESEETDVPVTTESVLDALKTATPEQLGAVGLQRVTQATESTAPAGKPTRATEGAESGREAELPKDSFLAKLMVERKVEAAGLPTAIAESMLAELPDRILESDVDARVASLKAALGMLEKHEMRPTVIATVAQESQEKKVKALDAFFSGDFRNGYRSFREAYIDFTGRTPRAFDEDFNRVIMRESIGTQSYDSAIRATESMTASSWNLVLGDSITRRLVAEYEQPNLQTWRSITSSIVPVNDFRTQRIDRIGGYGTLPAVAQGANYTALTSPTNEEVTYAITKRGGTEDITLEMIANDDVRAIAKIPVKLGLAAAQTLYRFVWDMIVTNATIYDTTALFTGTAGHANYVANAVGAALSQTSASAARLLMRSQTAYGDTADFIAPTPRYLVVVNDIEEIGWQLVTSAVALPTPANTPPDSTGAANTPNLHQGLGLIVLDYPAATDNWWMVADPNRTPTIEVGFYQGQQDPQLFTQSDPTVGSMFTADKVTYKIRHIYSGAVLDFRGFVKGK